MDSGELSRLTSSRKRIRPDHLPVLFINKHTGAELCFFVPKGGL
jgi:hypothetical protein